MSIPKGMARKFFPKYVGPYEIIKDYGNNSYMLNLPDSMKQRGVHPTFHSSRLRVHRPNDDRLFPGRSDTQTMEMENPDGEWAIDHILSHVGAHEDAIFEIKWKTGDVTWMPYRQITADGAVSDYFEILGIDSILELTEGNGNMPIDDPQIALAGARIAISSTEGAYKEGNNLHLCRALIDSYSSHSNPLPNYPFHSPQPSNNMPANAPIRYTNIAPSPGGKIAMTTSDGKHTHTYNKGQLLDILRFDKEMYELKMEGESFEGKVPFWYRVAEDAYNSNPASPSTLAHVEDDGFIFVDKATHLFHNTHLFGVLPIHEEEDTEKIILNLPPKARKLVLNMMASMSNAHMKGEDRISKNVAERQAKKSTRQKQEEFLASESSTPYRPSGKC